MVRFRLHHFRDSRRLFPDHRGLRLRHAEIAGARHIHVQHALRLLHRLQIQTALHHRHEQSRHRLGEIRHRVDGGFRGVRFKKKNFCCRVPRDYGGSFVYQSVPRSVDVSINILNIIVTFNKLFFFPTLKQNINKTHAQLSPHPLSSYA